MNLFSKCASAATLSSMLDYLLAIPPKTALSRCLLLTKIKLSALSTILLTLLSDECTSINSVHCTTEYPRYS